MDRGEVLVVQKDRALRELILSLFTLRRIRERLRVQEEYMINYGIVSLANETVSEKNVVFIKEVIIFAEELEQRILGGTFPLAQEEEKTINAKLSSLLDKLNLEGALLSLENKGLNNIVEHLKNIQNYLLVISSP